MPCFDIAVIIAGPDYRTLQPQLSSSYLPEKIILKVREPGQRRMNIQDSYALVCQERMGVASFNRPEDHLSGP